MSSTKTINFSLRQNKGIERSITFDALRQGEQFIGPNPIYVGLGSLWFSDFQIAHRLFGIDRMISIESDPEIYGRAKFNRPYRCIEVLEGDTGEVLPSLMDREGLAERPWIVWLDYDSSLDDDRISELAHLVENLTGGSVVLATFNARPTQYGRDSQLRREALTDLFGRDLVDPNLPDSSFNGVGLMRTLASVTLDFLLSTSIHAGRSERFVPSVNLLYRDSAPMVTVGGFIPKEEHVSSCRNCVSGGSWIGFEPLVIRTEPLTAREVSALCQLLPSEGISQEEVRTLGFEIGDDQLEFFKRHYLRYPTYAEIV